MFAKKQCSHATFQGGQVWKQIYYCANPEIPQEKMVPLCILPTLLRGCASNPNTSPKHTKCYWRHLLCRKAHLTPSSWNTTHSSTEVLVDLPLALKPTELTSETDMRLQTQHSDSSRWQEVIYQSLTQTCWDGLIWKESNFTLFKKFKS